jgi:hypothetical protein
MTKPFDFLQKFAINANVDDRAFKSDIYNKRLELINIALGWEGTTPKSHMIFHNVWKYPKDSSYVVCFGKYGKEYYEVSKQYEDTSDDQIPDNERKNCNDMMPTVFRNGSIVDSFRGRFDDIFALLEHCGNEGKINAVRALAILFYRNALLLDHNASNGNYSYNPPQELIDYICSEVPEYEGIPMEVYLHALDAIGFNEDVKYFTQGKLQKKTGIGRENNMKTYSYAAACVLGYEYWAGFVYKLMRGMGVSPISSKMFGTYFPEANVEFNEGTRRPRRMNSDIISVEGIVDHF